MLIFLYANPSTSESFKYQDEINDFFKKVEDEETNLEDQTIHWFAAVICVNMGKVLTVNINQIGAKHRFARKKVKFIPA